MIGECALARRGLTSLLSETMQLSTLYTDITGLSNFIVQWYFNPFADKDAELQRLQKLADASGCSVKAIVEDLI